MKYKHYLLLIGLLILIKYIWLPLWDSKQDNWQNQQYLQSNLNKTRALLAIKQDMSHAHMVMSQRLAEAESGLASTDNLISYKLTTQSNLEKLFKRFDIVISNSTWRDGLIDEGVQSLFLDIRYSGSLIQYLSFLDDLQQGEQYSNITIDTNQINVSGQSADNLGSINGAMSLSLAVKITSVEEL
ncbi:hypothetical protein ACRWQL_15595 [Shewanella sp. HL-SH4]|uniref:hypothetical protein n=1 Tax=Shewanella TaxID=22 RepID=UPI001CF89EA2|nr:hypothetical protein [Shewanella glacialimarina]UCX03978.1 hypothetical protein FJ709_05325 [Shewanella glacialimarina]